MALTYANKALPPLRAAKLAIVTAAIRLAAIGTLYKNQYTAEAAEGWLTSGMLFPRRLIPIQPASVAKQLAPSSVRRAVVVRVTSYTSFAQKQWGRMLLVATFRDPTSASCQYPTTLPLQ